MGKSFGHCQQLGLHSPEYAEIPADIDSVEIRSVDHKMGGASTRIRQGETVDVRPEGGDVKALFSLFGDRTITADLPLQTCLQAPAQSEITSQKRTWDFLLCVVIVTM